MNRPETLDAKLSEILAVLRRMLSALKGRIVPRRPELAPVLIRKGGARSDGRRA